MIFCTLDGTDCNTDGEVQQDECNYKIYGTASNTSFIKRYETYNAIARLTDYKEISVEFTVNETEKHIEGAFNLSAKVSVYISNVVEVMCSG